MPDMTLRQAMEHLRAAAERNGDLEVVGWCTLAIAANSEGYGQALEENGVRAVPGRWRTAKAPRAYVSGPRNYRPYNVFARFDSEDEAHRVADALNAIEYDRALNEGVRA